jgi:hypothetical protein
VLLLPWPWCRVCWGVGWVGMGGGGSGADDGLACAPSARFGAEVGAVRGALPGARLPSARRAPGARLTARPPGRPAQRHPACARARQGLRAPRSGHRSQRCAAPAPARAARRACGRRPPAVRGAVAAALRLHQAA